MSFFGGVKKLLKPAVGIRHGVAYDQLLQSSREMLALGKTYFVPAQAKHKESFAEALARLGLTEADLSQRCKIFARLMAVWCLMFLGLFSYTIWLVLHQAWLGALPTIALSFVMLSQAFRYHFWLFQIKHRKLGCSLREWFQTSFRRGPLS